MKRPKILLVDDMPANLSLLAGALGEHYELQAANSGEDALEAVAADRPDLVLLDVNMPGISGHEICRTLKGSPESADIPIIFLTGRDDEEDELLGLGLGAADYVTRPFSIPILRARIQTHLKMKEYQDKLAEMSFIDGLTGLPNRRRFDDFLAHFASLARRVETSIGLILMDIDHFKIYNDTFGHQAGDECLRKVAQALGSVRHRPADMVARYGGEEFVCVLPDTPAHGAWVVAQNLRESVLGLELPHAPASGNSIVTISLGVSAREHRPDVDPAALIREADQALYMAKHQGRNRVVSFQDSEKK